MGDNKKKIDIKDFSGPEFLNWLYLERAREDSIVKTHGWNTWLLIGALLSLLVFLYTKYRNAETFIQYRYLFVLTSLFISGIISCSWVRYLWQRNRGYDVKKLRTLLEQSPMLNNLSMLFVSIFCYILSALMDLGKILEWAWLICVGFYLFAILNVLFNRRRIVFASTIPSNFIILRHQQIFESIIAGVNTVIMSRCIHFLNNKQFLFNEFEISIVVILVGVVIYKLLKLNPIHFNVYRRSVDQIIDDVLYNNDSIENAFNEIKVKRVGFSPMYYIQSNVDYIYSLKQNMQNMCEKIKDAELLIPESHPITQENFNLVNIQLQEALTLANTIDKANTTITQKISDIIKQEFPALDAEFRTFIDNKENFIVDARSLVSELKILTSKLHNNVEKFLCHKYNCWCKKVNCSERKTSPPFLYRLKRVIMKVKCKIYVT